MIKKLLVGVVILTFANQTTVCQPFLKSFIEVQYNISAPDSIPEGYICVVFYSNSNKSKYRVYFYDTYEITIDFNQVKAQRRAMKTRKINVRAAVFRLFHSPHNPKVYIMLPVDSTLGACQKMPIQIYQLKLFDLCYKNRPCYAINKPERIYLLLGPCEPKRVFCGEWAGNIRI